MLFRFFLALCLAFLPLASRASVVELPKLLQNGLAQIGLAGAPFSSVTFRVIVPAGARNLRFDTGGGTGDCDVFVRFGAQPTNEDFDASSTGDSTKEHLMFSRPTAGSWYVKIDGARDFSGVTLIASYLRAVDAEAVPVLLPGPGTYSGLASVQMKTALRTGVVRFTMDGTNPTATSPIFTAAIRLTSDTEIRAQTFDRTSPRGPVLIAPYFVSPASFVTPVASGIVQQHRAGMTGSNTLFKITVPPAVRLLNVLTRGGHGDIAVLVRPPTGAHNFKRVGTANRTDLAIPFPAAGDWIIELRARSNFDGCSLQATYRFAKADLVVWPDRLEPYESTETFTAEDCEVQEGMITAGTHRLLRFSTESRNMGGGPAVVGRPEGNPNFEFQECHGHYHFKGFAAYTLRALDGTPVAQGRKVSFCLEDIIRWDPAAARTTKFDCENQGIQAGWSDIYDGGLAGQWIDITNVPAGDYRLEITVNPEHLIEEADYTNNTTLLPVTISDP